MLGPCHFAKRLTDATQVARGSAEQFGRQSWLRNELQRKHGKSVSAQAVSNWFGGRSMPRPELLSQIANILEVNPAWLGMGAEPRVSPRVGAQPSQTPVISQIGGVPKINISIPRSLYNKISSLALIEGCNVEEYIKFHLIKQFG